MLIIEQIAVLDDNYSYILCDSNSGACAVIDPSLAKPVLHLLAKQQLTLHFVLCTHHHGDHVGGALELQAITGCRVIASHYDVSRIAGCNQGVGEGDYLILGTDKIHVMDTPGHTLGHIVYYLPEQHALFCGDTLFSMGCGRLFEGQAQQLWQSLQKIKQLPPQTLLYCAHEYTQANGKFAMYIEPGNADIEQRVQDVARLRAMQQTTVPSSLAMEMLTNPFLRENSPLLKKTLDCEMASALETFTRLRQAKDHF